MQLAFFIRLSLYYLGPLATVVLGWGGMSVAVSFALAILASFAHFYYRTIYVPVPVYLIRLAAFTAIQLILAAVFKAGGWTTVDSPYVSYSRFPYYSSDQARQFDPSVDRAPGGVEPLTGPFAQNFLSQKTTPVTMSIVLPCANEGKFAWKTVESIVDATPAERLHEIVVVDDGSTPPLATQFPPEILARGKVLFVRHESHTGLINAKAAGANKASGDIVVFLDCHVKPDKNWSHSIVAHIKQNYKRVVVPSITGLNPDTWEEERNGDGLAKCYLTWDADFKWFDSDDEYIAVMSGGLLAMSRQWWIETGGYDSSMKGWGGENLDQSLRIWLCGGEIVQAKDSFVGHMWRTHDKPQTAAHYVVPPGSVISNRFKGTSVWMGEWVEKLFSFPVFAPFRLAPPDTTSIQAVKNRLQCRPFSFYIDRFYKVYHWGGLLPTNVFHLRDARSGLCIQRTGPDEVHLGQCSDDSLGQLWHLSNRDGETCCSGFRNWNSDQCLSGGWVGAKGKTFTCNVGGLNFDEYVRLNEKHQLEMTKRPGACVGGKIVERTKAVVGQCGGSSGFKKVSLPRDNRIEEPFLLESVSRPGICLAFMGTLVELHDCDSRNIQQQFELIDLQKIGEQRVSPAGSLNPKLCLDFGAGKSASKQQVVALYNCYLDVPNSNQDAQLVSIGNGSFSLKFNRMDQCVAVPELWQQNSQRPANEPLVLSECVNDNGIVKRGQTFEKMVSEYNNGSFALKTKDGTCLARGPGDKLVLSSDACMTELFQQDPNDPQKRLKHLPSGMCLDGGDAKSPILYQCYAGENANQQIDMTSGKYIKVDRTGTCLDFEPTEASTMNIISCTEAETRFKWEMYKPFIPIETKLYNDHKAIAGLVQP